MKYFVVDAFTDSLFKGNPAGVCLIDRWPSEETMQKIAAENRLSETAFVYRRDDGDYDIRFFTPGTEVELCGHATLGTSYVLAHFVDPEQEEFRYHSKGGALRAKRLDGDRFELDFPAWTPEPVPVTQAMRNALGFEPEGAWLTRDLVLLVDSPETVLNYQPKLAAIASIPEGTGLFLTAKGTESDFVCRTFFPKISIDEDPVCGSANCTLIPFWSERLGKKELINYQLSPRTGVVYCKDEGERVRISGHATLYLTGEINI